MCMTGHSGGKRMGLLDQGEDRCMGHSRVEWSWQLVPHGVLGTSRCEGEEGACTCRRRSWAPRPCPPRPGDSTWSIDRQAGRLGGRLGTGRRRREGVWSPDPGSTARFVASDRPPPFIAPQSTALPLPSIHSSTASTSSLPRCPDSTAPSCASATRCSTSRPRSTRRSCRNMT